MHTYFFIRVNGYFVRIGFTDILYVEGCRNYARIVTADKVYLASITLKRMEELLPAGAFIRVHKSYIVALERVSSFNSEHLFIGAKEIPIGMNYSRVLERKVLILQEQLNSVSVSAGRLPNQEGISGDNSPATSGTSMLEEVRYSRAI